MSKDELTKEQLEELKKLTDDIINEAKKVKEDYKENPSNLDDTNCVEVHEDSPYLMEREERYKGLVVTSGSVDIGSFKLHEL